MRPVYLGKGLALVDTNRKGIRRMSMATEVGTRVMVRDMLATGSTVLAKGNNLVGAQSCPRRDRALPGGLGIVGELLQHVTYR
jgi:hypothetical protein